MKKTGLESLQLQIKHLLLNWKARGIIVDYQKDRSAEVN